jgi:hypothetical protein
MDNITHRKQIPSFLNKRNAKVGIELGTAKGRFSKTLLGRSNLSLLYSIDVWNHKHHNDNEYLYAMRLLNPFGERSICLRMPFENALLLFEDEYFDFIYIDGFAEEGQGGVHVFHDWWAKLKVGGVYSGHDYAKRFPKNIENVDMFMSDKNLSFHTTNERYPSWITIKKSNV